MFLIYLFLAVIALIQIATLVIVVAIGNNMVRLIQRQEEPPAPSIGRPLPFTGLDDVKTAQTTYDPRFNPQR